MSYLTMEVEIDHGKVVAKEPGRLPEKASGLLTIFQADSIASTHSLLHALDALHKHLRLDDQTAVQWMTAVRDGRS